MIYKRITFITFIIVALFACNQQKEPIRYTHDLSELNWKLWVDTTAQWENDSLYLPPVNIEEIPANKPTCGWENLYINKGIKIKIPATVEQYLWDWDKDSLGTEGDYIGVSWFYTSFEIPKTSGNRRIYLDFESVRLRAEVFVNSKLAGYDCIGNTPFKVDVSNFIKSGELNQLAIRITDPGGNFQWDDYHLDKFGKIWIPPSHGFGGITGKVKLVCTNKEYIDDVFIKNTPEINKIEIETILKSEIGDTISGNLEFLIFEDKEMKKMVLSQKKILNKILSSDKLSIQLTIPDAEYWSPNKPKLYYLQVKLSNNNGLKDEYNKHFGLRWFEAKIVNGNKDFYLNNKRIFITSGISWGFWPENGIFPTLELAEKQILSLKELGLNMFNFHRGIGQEILMDKADELGILVYEEPGGYRCPNENIWFWKERNEGNNVPVEDVQIAWQLRKEKLNRMVKRDRSHPSLIIYNLINEALMNPTAENKKDIYDAHVLDPTRYIIFSSHSFHSHFFPEYPAGDCPTEPAEAKLYMEPNNHELLYQGWWDNHHALGTGCIIDSMHYKNPKDYNLYTENRGEIVFFGEEGATNAPAVLENIITNQINPISLKGWDAKHYEKSYNSIENFINEKGFQKVFPTVTDYTQGLANISYYYHGKMIENCRISNITDSYVINGIEDPKTGFYSGIVDIYRNIKGNPELISKYTIPLYLAVKLRNKVVSHNDNLIADFFIINENIIQGNYKLNINVFAGNINIKSDTISVLVKGGEHHGQLICEGFEIEIPNSINGYIDIKCTLNHNDGTVLGDEKAFVVLESKIDKLSNDWRILDDTGFISRFLNKQSIPIPQKFKRGAGSGKHLFVDGILPDNAIGDIKKWVKRGNSLIILNDADKWAELLAQEDMIDYYGKLDLSSGWKGGGMFLKEHEIFSGLPVNMAMGWEYQVFANYYANRYLLILDNEETLIGGVGAQQHKFGSAFAIIKYGEGEIYLSTLDFTKSINSEEKSSIIAQKLLFNIVEYVSN